MSNLREINAQHNRISEPYNETLHTRNYNTMPELLLPADGEDGGEDMGESEA